MNLERQHKAFVDSLVASGVLRSPRVTQAFEQVMRHDFLPEHLKNHAYVDHAIAVKTRPAPTGKSECISSSTQPSLMAMMLEALELDEGMRVLEIGTGTGYNAALMAEIVGPTGHVTSMEIDVQLANSARARFQNDGRIQVVTADALNAPVEEREFDSLIVTASAPDIPVHWTKAIKTGARFAIPLYVGGVDYLFLGVKSDTGLCGFFECFTVFTGLDERVRGSATARSFGVGGELVLYDATLFDPRPTAADWILVRPRLHREPDFESADALEGFHVLTNLAGSFAGQGLRVAHSESQDFGFSGYGFYFWDDHGMVLFPAGFGSGCRLGFGRTSAMDLLADQAKNEWVRLGGPSLRSFHLEYRNVIGRMNPNERSICFQSGKLIGSLQPTSHRRTNH